MNQDQLADKMGPKPASSVRKPFFSSFARMLGLATGLLFLLLGGGPLGQTRTGKDEYVRMSAPTLLTFDELVQLEKMDDPNPQLATRLDKLLHTPFLSNEAFYGGAKPFRPSSETLGPFLRAIMWNIERGIAFDGIRISLTEPDKFGKYIEQKKDPKSKPLTKEALGEVKKQLDILKPTDLFILNEVDYGVTRTDYRNVARELAQALKMNYAYAVEFLEIDPLNLGLEKVNLEDKAAQEDIQKSFEVDKSRYLGLHGTAVLSRYPIRKATVRSLPVCYDWFLGEKKEISKLESVEADGGQPRIHGENCARGSPRRPYDTHRRTCGAGISHGSSNRGCSALGDEVQAGMPKKTNDRDPGMDQGGAKSGHSRWGLQYIRRR